MSDNEDNNNSNNGNDTSMKKNCNAEYYGNTVILDSKFDKANGIHSGTYGDVFRATNKVTNENVALKYLKIDKHTSKSGFPQTALREIQILTHLAQLGNDNNNNVNKSNNNQNSDNSNDNDNKHGNDSNKSDNRTSNGFENIIKLNEMFICKDNIRKCGMVFEFADHDLHTLIALRESKQIGFACDEIKCLLKQLLNGLNFLHSNWIIHRDLKPNNLLIQNDGTLKICDFGMARYYSSPLGKYTPHCITLWYRAPEMLLDLTQYGQSVDMWSVGCIFAELLRLKPLFRADSELGLINLMLETLGDPSIANNNRHSNSESEIEVDENAFELNPMASVAGTWDEYKELTKKCAITRKNGPSSIKNFNKKNKNKNKNRNKKHRKHSKRNTNDDNVPSIVTEFAAKSRNFYGNDSYHVVLTKLGMNLLLCLLSWDPKKRITAKKGLKHDWFKEQPLPRNKALLDTHPSTNKVSRHDAFRKLHHEGKQLKHLTRGFLH